MENIQELKKYLSKEIVEVTFTKKDGSQRIMKCTLNPSTIPQDLAPKGSDKAFSKDVQRVFDIEASAWRSFRNDSIISFRKIEG